MPYIIVEGALTAPQKDFEDVFKVEVSGLKAQELSDLKNFHPGANRDNYTITFHQHPCVILNALEVLGFKVVTSAPKLNGNQEQTFVWTMRKEFEK